MSSCEPVAGRSLLLGDCDDSNAARSPVAPEICDGVDNDCDGVVDDGATSSFYRDADGDGFGVATESVAACTRPTGYSPVAGDCDDTSRSRSPALPELCDELDNDCDAAVDEGVFVPLWYADADGDGFGDPTSTTASCRAPTGHVATASDCDDTRANRNPAAPEVCDEVDNDCDGLVDDGVLTTYYRDSDGDGFGRGDAASRLQACTLPSGYSVFAGDCDDTRANRNPGAPEVCDGLDNDCNGLLDAPGEDPDRDGVAGLACGGTDCDNARADVYPGAPELCDGRDNDCDGVLGVAEDADRDGVAGLACGAACTGPFANLFRVDTLNASGAAVVHGDDQLLVVPDSSRGSLDLVMVHLGRDDIAVSRPRTYLTTDLEHTELAPDVAWVGTGLGIAFLADTSDSWGLWYMRVSPDGAVLRAPVSLGAAFGEEIGATDGAAHSGYPRITHRPSSDTLLVLSLSPTGRWQRTMVNAGTGAITSSPLDLGLARHGAAQATVAYNPTTDTFLVAALHVVAGGFEMRARVLSGSGSLASSWTSIGETHATVRGLNHPSVAADGTSFVVAYVASSTHLGLARVSSTGTLVTSPITFPTIVGEPNADLSVQVGPSHLALSWSQAASFRNRSDFSAVSGVYRITTPWPGAGSRALFDDGVFMVAGDNYYDLIANRAGCY